MGALSEEDRQRRAVLLCSHFVRNFAYYRIGFRRHVSGSLSQFYLTINGNFIDIAILEWCKLFADARGKHHWAKLVEDPSFINFLIAEIGLTSEEFEEYIKVMRRYRDKFIAHLDEDPEMYIPHLDTALKSVLFLHKTICNQAAASSHMRGLIVDINAYHEICRLDAEKFYRLRSQKLRSE